jgi:hypothetical protein
VKEICVPARDLPARTNLEQYKKQAKELLDACKSGDDDAIRRVREQARGVGASGPPTKKILSWTAPRPYPACSR